MREDMRVFIIVVFFTLCSAFAFSQDQTPMARGSVPEALLRPQRGETPRYPIDTVIGELGRGNATEAAYNFAVSICEALLAGDASAAPLSSLSTTDRNRYVSTLDLIAPLSYRLGGGREEADGAISFLVRYIGKDQGISGELYIRFLQGRWIFEELLLDDARSREVEQQESVYRYDFNPYERFF